MNKDNAKEFLPLVQALADGKTIQIRLSEQGEWRDCELPEFCGTPGFYRIKPEPRKPREWVKYVSDYNGGKTLYNGRIPGATERVRGREIIED